MNYGYIRVSTDRQTLENQRHEILGFCRKENLSVDSWIEETISGTKTYSKRALGRRLRKVLAFAFGLSAEIERNLISQRTKEALDRRRSMGKHLGRPFGANNQVYRLDSKQAIIYKLLLKGVSHKIIASRCGVSRATLERWLKKARTNGC